MKRAWMAALIAAALLLAPAMAGEESVDLENLFAGDKQEAAAPVPPAPKPADSRNPAAALPAALLLLVALVSIRPSKKKKRSP